MIMHAGLLCYHVSLGLTVYQCESFTGHMTGKVLSGLIPAECTHSIACVGFGTSAKLIGLTSTDQEDMLLES